MKTGHKDTESTITVERMWQNGPLRQFAKGTAQPQSNFIRYTSKTLDGYAGSYVCESCRNTCAGVYRVGNRWVGGCCRGRTHAT